MEFLIGRVVLDALVNTGIKKLTSKIFSDEGVDINILEEVQDTALGNGGLGRLAACFIESAATTGYPLLACLNSSSTDLNRPKYPMTGQQKAILGSNLMKQIQ